MGLRLAAVKGMNDLLPGEAERFRALEELFRLTTERYGYREIRVPCVEPTPLYVRSVGEGTDIVDKEMYSFVFHDEPLTLRPEGTAGVVRAYVEHALHTREPISRFFYTGPMFRGERPARGRYRQFHQAGCEVFGDPGPVVDAEMIDMLVQILSSLKIQGLEVLVNSIGGQGTKNRYRERLVEFLTPRAADLSDDSRRRLTTNPLRILDSKDPRDAAIVQDAPSVLDVLDDDDRRHFDGVCALLTRLGTPFRIEPRLVRGLDYYTRTLFEIRGHGGELGAQNTLCGGGRYDGLVEELGGPKTPAIGFAVGIERLLLIADVPPKTLAPPIVVAALGDKTSGEALALAAELRAAGQHVIVEARGGSLRAMLRRANALGSSLALIVGDGELERGVVQVKELNAHRQEDVPRSEVLAKVRALAVAVAAPTKDEAST